jgi:hypothetical protein
MSGGMCGTATLWGPFSAKTKPTREPQCSTPNRRVFSVSGALHDSWGFTLDADSLGSYLRPSVINH